MGLGLMVSHTEPYSGFFLFPHTLAHLHVQFH